MEGKLTISRIGDKIEIALEDRSSSIEFVRASVGLQDFTKALTGLALIPVEFELKGSELVGKELEVKREEPW